MADDPVASLARATDAFARLVDGVEPGQWPLPTPCPDWNVRQLMEHMVSGQRLFAQVVRGVPAEDAARERDAWAGLAGRDAAAAYRESAADLVAAFGEPGALERTVTIPAGTVPGAVALHLRTTEALVHGWDLARACGLAFDPPEDVAEGEIAFSGPMLEFLPPDRRAQRFGQSRAVDGDAPAIDRLAALLGRDPAGDGSR